MMRRLSGKVLSSSPISAVSNSWAPSLPSGSSRKLGVVGLAAPLMVVLGAVVDQQQDAGGGDAVHQQIEERLGFAVDPVEVLELDDQRLAQALARQNPLDRLQGPPPPGLRVECRQRVVTLGNAKQGIEVRQSVFQRAVENHYLAGDLLAPGALVIFRSDLEVAFEQVDYRQIGRSLAVRD